ncbi:MAG: PEP-CTERM sorting domain-containing protein [Smithella sp.]|jgi:hypothetical protein|nr:PEP-CTERM sorting domain-containing protein [Smithella sp.]
MKAFPFVGAGYTTGLASTVYLNNFVITGSDIYNSNGFQDFNIGNLSVQEGGLAGNESSSVPEPATSMLLGPGLPGVISLRKKIK